MTTNEFNLDGFTGIQRVTEIYWQAEKLEEEARAALDNNDHARASELLDAAKRMYDRADDELEEVKTRLYEESYPFGGRKR
ncbi:hypothetical protein ACTACK_17920 [Pseudomonas syringae]|uniref:hypothetical protein n=1 Tax=Pseudomonas syringae TaxID=317 RepID=UPI003F756F8C